jgi:hypothetical protein
MAGYRLEKSTAITLVASSHIALLAAQAPKPAFEAVAVKKRSEPLLSPGRSQSVGGLFIRESTSLPALILCA